MTAYYNEYDKSAAQWLRNLIEAGHIAPGYVDERSVEDVYPSDLRGFTQCHFFAGIGVWSYALRNAGWGDNRPVWTGSCPCQPFSAAGKGAGFDDERHLWPAFHHLIKQCAPAIVFGEQVASKAVEPWIDLVHADVEALGYAFGCVAFPSAGVGAPHIRDRAYWVANTESCGRPGKLLRAGLRVQTNGAPQDGIAVRLANTGRDTDRRQAEPAHHVATEVDRPANQFGGCGGTPGGLADTDGGNASAKREQRSGQQRQQQEDSVVGGLADYLMQQRPDGQPGIGHVDDAGGWLEGAAAPAGLCDDLRPGPTNGFWRDADWLGCRDAKWRPVEPSAFPLAHGSPARVGRLRGYGNALNAQAAQIFVESVMGKP